MELSAQACNVGGYMHIVFLIHLFPIGGRATGGAANYVANMAKIMAQYGHMVEIITESDEEESFEWNGVLVHKIRATKGFHDTGRAMPTYKKVLKNIWRSYWYNKKVAELNKEKKIDLVQSVDAYGLALLRKKNIRYVIRLSYYPTLWSGAAKEEFDFNQCITKKNLDEVIQIIALKRADLLIVPSVFMQKIIINKMRIKPQIVESPILIDNDNYNLNEKFCENKYFLTFSELSYRKSIHIVIRIIDTLLEKYTDMKYVVIGRDREILWEGKYTLASEIFEQNIVKNKDRFVFMGEISDRKRLFSIIKYANMCILPTRVDNLPNACLEAMALGKIVISSTSKQGTSVEQLITDGYNGFLTEVDDVESLLKKISQVKQLSESEKKLIGERAKDRVKDLTPEKVYKEMMEIYREVLKR